MNQGAVRDLTSGPIRITPSWSYPKRRVWPGILSIPLLVTCALVPVQIEAATTTPEAILAQGAYYPNQICIAKGHTDISAFTYSSKECLQGGSTHSGSGKGAFNGEARATTTYGVPTPSKLALSVFAHAEGTVSKDFTGSYHYRSKATDTFLDQITLTGGPSGDVAILEVVLNVVGDLAVSGSGANDSVSLKITVSSPLGSDEYEIIGPATIDTEKSFEVPYEFNTSGEFKIVVEGRAGQATTGPFSATQSVNFEQTITLESVSVKDPPGGQVISDTGFEYPTASGSPSPPSNTAPTVDIGDPKDGESFSTTDPISFNGTGTDIEDGNLLGSSLSWSSNLQGDLGSGTTLTPSLNPGNHIITLTGTDHEGASGTDSVSISVATPGDNDSIPDPTVVAWEADAQNARGNWSNSGWANRSFRILLKGNAITTTGSTVQLTLRGRTSGSYTVQRVSLVRRDGTTLNGVESTRQNVTFGGTWNDGVTVPAGGTITSDPIDFELAAGQDVFLTYWVPAGEPTVYRNGGSGTSAWTIRGNDLSNTMDWQGLSFSATRSHVYILERLLLVP